MSKVAFVGLGVMGYPMAGHLQDAGHSVTVYNRTVSTAVAWVAAHGGRQAGTPARAASGAEFVMTCVGNDDDLRAVVLGEKGVLAGMEPGSILIDHTTASAAVARELAAVAAERGVAFVDAPVSGGQQGAQNGALTIMCGGNADTFERAAAVMKAYAKATTHLGPVGAGQLTKMVNQICVAGVVQGLAEGMNFAAHAGLDVQKVIDAISQGAASSWQMVNRHKTMIAGEYEHGFAVDWMRKDLDIVLAEAAHNGADLTVTAQINEFYKEVQAMGGGRWDTSALLKRLQERL
ncbi:MAG: NAD(P)-dependent oxidoreductase [Alcanivoracaceae bacterium]|jgi:3-hydroxyisobutyrate dehydrogenase-like beta-hydroxyacid dehydrogenase|nr:NAD(P)-dependent oxidoreductase [Alcanivoracaceae bacterium]